MTDINWSEFDSLPEMNCTCNCGTNFRSHFKVTREAGVRRTTTRKSCPKCDRNDNTCTVGSDPETQTLRG